MKRPDLDAIEARVKAAMLGPWTAHPAGCEVVADSYDNGNLVADCFENENAEFIANARTDVPELIAYVRELEAELAAWRDDDTVALLSSKTEAK